MWKLESDLSGVFLYYSVLFLFFEAETLTEPRNDCFVYTGQLGSSQDPPSPPPVVTGVHCHASFSVDSVDLNSGPHACKAGILLMDSYPQSQEIYF